MKYLSVLSIAAIFSIAVSCQDANNNRDDNRLNDGPGNIENPSMEHEQPRVYDSISDTTNRRLDDNDTMNYERRPGTSPQ